MSPTRVPRGVWRLLERFWAWFKSDTGGAIMQLVSAGGILALGLIFFFYSSQTHEALCNFRADLQGRYDRSAQFLNDHPEFQRAKIGPVVITRSQLAVQLNGQKATLRSLDDLNC